MAEDKIFIYKTEAELMKLLSEGVKRHQMTSCGIFQEFGYTMKSLFVSNIPKIASFPTEKKINKIT